MIKQLRRRMILFNMALIGAVLLVILTVVSVNSYSNAKNELERGLSQVLERTGKQEHSMGGFPNNINGAGGNNGEIIGNSEDEAKYDRMIGKPDFHGEPMVQIGSYVLVKTDRGGNIISTDESNVTIDSDTLNSAVKLALDSNDKSGMLSDYGLTYSKDDDRFHSADGGTRVVLADSSSVYSVLRNTIIICVILFIAAMGLIFLISLGLSALAIKPVKESWEKQKQFVADASHELKTPLTVILANNNIMMSHSTDPEQRKWLESTEEEAGHMKKLIDQMLFLAKSDAGENRAEKTDVDFSDTVEGISLNFEPVAFEKEVMIDARITPEIILHGNALQLSQLAHILIDNAVKYSKPDSTVTIILEKKNDGIEFSVNNLGIPIASEDLPHIFDRFYRAEKSRTTKGYGLGLAIASEIVRTHGGKITVESSEELGTTFKTIFKS